MATLLTWIALLSIAGVVYSYAGYPLLLWIAKTIGIGNDVEQQAGEPNESVDATHAKRVDVILAAYNEEDGIRDCVTALLNQVDESLDIHIFIGSDASDDNTNQILRSMPSERLHLFLYEQRRGKTAILNDLLQEVDAPYLVFSDADIVFEPDTIQNLVHELERGAWACVCGHLNLLDAESGQNLDGAYWRYERIVRQLEADFNSLVSIPGAIFCINKDEVTSIPDGCINDDLYQALNLLTHGRKTGYAKLAHASGYNTTSLEAERSRRLRIGMGNYQAEKHFRSKLSRFSPLSAFQYLSHKVLRWYSPHLLILGLAASAIGSLFGSVLCGWLLMAQLAVYIFCGVTKLLSAHVKLPGIVLLPLFFLEMNLAFLTAYHRYLENDVNHLWGTPRSNINLQPSDTGEASHG